MPDMPRKLPPHVTSQRTRHGKVVFYFREGHGPRVRLPEPTDKAFKAAYRDCLSGTPQRPAREAGGSLAWLIGRYKESAHWANLKLSTRQMRDNILKHVITEAGHVPYAVITRKHINEGIDRRKPHAGATFRKVMSQLFAWAVSVDLVEVNPAAGAVRHKIKSDGFHTWTVAEVRQFWTRWPIGTREHLASCIMLFTGLRRSDVYRLGRQHVTGNVLTIRTEKTGGIAHMPMFPALQAAIESTQTGDLAFMVTSRGEPFTSAASFGNWFGKACRAAGVPGRAHGLRKAGATIAADAGATAHELMAMFCWSRLAEAERYTKDADRRRLAAGSAERIADAMSPTLDPVRENRHNKPRKSKT